MTIALIDGDVLLYTVGYSVEHTRRKAYIDGEFIQEFDSYKDLYDWIAYLSPELLSNLKVEEYKEVEDISHCFQNLKTTFDSILRETQASEYIVYLSGNNNFRFNISPTYKANRDPEAKPRYFEELKKKIRSDYLAEIVDGQEADDALGIRQTEDTIICTKDKDLNMIPGWNYNLSTKVKRYISKEEAIKFFYKQLLTGDPVDNVEGIKGIGDIRADKLLEGLTEEKDLYATVLEQYQKQYKEKAKEVLRDTGRLLWIRRREGEVWELPE
jgi:5'-3' exonuclease